MSGKDCIRVGGYRADSGGFAQTLVRRVRGADVVAVTDVNQELASAWAVTWGLPRWFPLLRRC